MEHVWLCLWDNVTCLVFIALVSYILQGIFEWHSGGGSETSIISFKPIPSLAKGVGPLHLD